MYCITTCIITYLKRFSNQSLPLQHDSLEKIISTALQKFKVAGDVKEWALVSDQTNKYITEDVSVYCMNNYIYDNALYIDILYTSTLLKGHSCDGLHFYQFTKFPLEGYFCALWNTSVNLQKVSFKS